MEKVTKTVETKQFIEILTSLALVDTVKKDKLSLYISEFRDNNKSTLEAYYKDLDKIDRKYCSVDSDKNFFIDAKGSPIYTKFTKENLVTRERDIEVLLAKKIDIETVECPDLSRVSSLHISVIKTLNGFVFNVTNEWLLELYEPKENKANK